MTSPSQTHVSPVCKALFQRWVDYAGRFPPASLDLPTTMQNFQQYARDQAAWMLGRLVLPCSDWATAVDSSPVPHSTTPIAVSLVGSADDLAAAVSCRPAASHHGLRVVALETKWAPSHIDTLRHLSQMVEHVYVELASADVHSATLRALQQAGCRAKFRTGGVVATAIPSSQELVGFMAACRQHAVPYKLTAGLHHAFRGTYPLTYDAQSDTAIMHGFVQVALAALILEDDPDAADTAESVLAGDGRSAVRIDQQSIRWKAYEFGIEACRNLRRRSLHAVGSCSFREPLSELLAWC